MARDKHHITSAEEYQRYLDGNMSPRERHAFEKKLLDDEFEAEAMDGLSTIQPDELRQDLDALKARMHHRYQRSRTPLIWRAAAAITLLAAFSFAIYFILNIDNSREVVQTKGPEREVAGSQEFDSADLAEPTPTARDQDSLALLSYRQEAEEEREQNQMGAKRELQKSTPAEENVQLDEVADEIELDLGEEEISLERAPITDNVIEEVAPAGRLELAKEEPAAEPDAEEVAPAVKLQVEEVAPAALPTIDENETLEAPIEMEDPRRAKRRVTREQVAPTVMDRSRYLPRVTDVRTVTGTITSNEDDAAIPGVNVIVKGSSIGTTSDIDGNYSIDVPKDEDVTLVYSYIGLNSEEVQVEDKESIDVNMEPDFNELSEVVVTAYGEDTDTERKPYSYVPPKPAGGIGEFMDYVKEHIRYPASGIPDQVKGTVKLRLTVNARGVISDIEVIRSLGPQFDEEAMRLVKEGPEWEPAMENDSAVSRDVSVKIRFRPPE